MKHNTAQAWAILRENGCVDGEAPEGEDFASPWFVKALLAFSGWLAAIFLLGFIGVAFEFILKNGPASCTVGLVLVGCGFALLRMEDNDFVGHLGLAVSLAGQALAVYGIYEITGHHEMRVWLFLALLQCVLAALMPNEVHRVVSSMVGALAFSMAFSDQGILPVISAAVMLGASFCWLHEFHYPNRMNQIRAMGYGLVLALMALECTTLFGNRVLGNSFGHSHTGFWSHPWFGEGLMGAVAVTVVWTLLRRYKQPVNGRLSILALVGTVFLCAVSINVKGLIVGMFILCLGFYGSNSTLLGLGMVSLIVSMSSYYYLLDATLLEKSLSLFLTGLFLLCVRWVTSRIIFFRNEVHHG